MNTQHETTIVNPHFEKMKKSAQQSRYHLSLYPVLLLGLMIASCLDSDKFMSLFIDEPWVTIGVAGYILAMFVYAWNKGKVLN